MQLRREKSRDCLPCGGLFRAFLAAARSAAHRRTVQRNLYGKLLAVVRTALPDQFIGKVLLLFPLHKLLQFRFIVSGFFRLGKLLLQGIFLFLCLTIRFR